MAYPLIRLRTGQTNEPNSGDFGPRAAGRPGTDASGMPMNCFVVFVTLCSRFVGVGRDKPGERVNKRGLRESHPGTEVNEENEVKSNSLSSCDESIRRGAIVCGSNAPANSSLPTQEFTMTEHSTIALRKIFFLTLNYLPVETYLDSSNSILFGDRIHDVQFNRGVARRGQFCAPPPPFGGHSSAPGRERVHRRLSLEPATAANHDCLCDYHPA